MFTLRNVRDHSIGGITYIAGGGAVSSSVLIEISGRYSEIIRVADFFRGLVDELEAS